MGDPSCIEGKVVEGGGEGGLALLRSMLWHDLACF